MLSLKLSIVTAPSALSSQLPNQMEGPPQFGNTSSRNDRHLVLGVLQQALVMRQPKPGLMHHSDRGSTYAAYEYQAQLAAVEAVCSMSRKGDCYDNAAMESFFSSLKKERMHRRKYWGRDETTDDMKSYIEDFYNRRRRRSHLGDISPVEYETCLSSSGQRNNFVKFVCRTTES